MKVELKFIQPGKPVQNAYIESFNGKFRDECLNQHWFLNLEDARKEIEKWRKDYNQNRPHSSLKYKTPNEMLIWDDLWFWGFITQKSEKKSVRKIEWNLAKYYAIFHATKDKKSISEIEELAEEFIQIIRPKQVVGV